MLLVVVVCIAVSAAFMFLFFLELAPKRPQVVTQRLSELQSAGGGQSRAVLQRRRRAEQTERLKSVVQTFGESLQERSDAPGAIRLRLVQAGYPTSAAVPLYLGTRVLLPAALGIGALILLPLLRFSPLACVLGVVYFAGLGYIVPTLHVGMRIRKRQKEMQRALPDALDMLVVSVEAGLGLNQALVRVSEEIYRLSPVLSEQMSLVNLEIRAGTAREEALRNLADRTGLPDLASLTAMLIQTDRFGTSVAQALRIHADTMRTKRRQRAEEAAAKTTIKLIFPLVFCIFPALFVVILGPAVIQIMRAL
ncbi:MAG: type II secretion system F family protein, partial [Gemmatimonadales bacterium]